MKWFKESYQCSLEKSPVCWKSHWNFMKIMLVSIWDEFRYDERWKLPLYSVSSEDEKRMWQFRRSSCLGENSWCFLSLKDQISGWAQHKFRNRSDQIDEFLILGCSSEHHGFEARIYPPLLCLDCSCCCSGGKASYQLLLWFLRWRLQSPGGDQIWERSDLQKLH